MNFESITTDPSEPFSMVSVLFFIKTLHHELFKIRPWSSQHGSLRLGIALCSKNIDGFTRYGSQFILHDDIGSRNGHVYVDQLTLL